MHGVFFGFAFYFLPGVVFGDGFEVEASGAFAGDVAFGGLFIQGVELKQIFV